MDNTRQITVVLGDEFDETLRLRLQRILRELRAFPDGVVDRSLVGSQDIQRLDVFIDGQRLRIEAETYCGLSIAGPPELVARVKHKLAD